MPTDPGFFLFGFVVGLVGGGLRMLRNNPLLDGLGTAMICAGYAFIFLTILRMMEETDGEKQLQALLLGLTALAALSLTAWIGNRVQQNGS